MGKDDIQVTDKTLNLLTNEDTGDESIEELINMPEVKALIEKGKETGNLTSNDLDAALEDVDLDSEEIDSIYMYLQKEGITLRFSRTNRASIDRVSNIVHNKYFCQSIVPPSLCILSFVFFYIHPFYFLYSQ